MPTPRVFLLSVLLAAAPACYRPALVDCSATCTARGGCPVGQTCVGGLCASAGTLCLVNPERGDADPVDTRDRRDSAEDVPAAVEGGGLAGDPTLVGGVPAALQRPDGVLDLFWLGPGRDGEGQLLYRQFHEGGPIGTLLDLGAPGGVSIHGPPSPISWRPGRFDIFLRGSDGALWQRWHFTFWRPWAKLDGAITSAPVACAWAPDRLDVFARGVAGDLQHRYYDRGGSEFTWYDWESLGGSITSAPAVASPGPEQLEVFARGTAGEVLNRSFIHGWRSWRTLGGGATIGAPSATSRRPGAVDVYTRDPAGRVLHLVLTASTPGAWETTAVVAPSDMQVLATSRTRVEAFARQADGRLWHQVFIHPE